MAARMHRASSCISSVERDCYQADPWLTDHNWMSGADTLSYYARAPWVRLTAGSAEVPEIYDRSNDPVLCWADSILSREVNKGIQIFLRSAWEGAKAYAQSGSADPAVPQRLADALVAEAVERLEATYP